VLLALFSGVPDIPFLGSIPGISLLLAFSSVSGYRTTAIRTIIFQTFGILNCQINLSTVFIVQEALSNADKGTLTLSAI
jgi:hypothetical protein